MNQHQIKSLLSMLAMTRDDELTCGDCQQQMAEFVEVQLAGKSVPESLRCVDEHLQLCGECREEFSALRSALSECVIEPLTR